MPISPDVCTGRLVAVVVGVLYWLLWPITNRFSLRWHLTAELRPSGAGVWREPEGAEGFTPGGESGGNVGGQQDRTEKVLNCSGPKRARTQLSVGGTGQPELRFIPTPNNGNWPDMDACFQPQPSRILIRPYSSVLNIHHQAPRLPYMSNLLMCACTVLFCNIDQTVPCCLQPRP